MIERLEKDLRTLFPERNFEKINAQKSDYQEITQKYYTLEKGFFLIEHFEDVLYEQNLLLGQNPEELAKEEERRKGITAGLNLRRDKLAQYPIALIVLVAADQEIPYVKKIIEKMPDLWSFRSLVVDLKVEKALYAQDKVFFEQMPTLDKIPLTNEEISIQEKELTRLQKALKNSLPNDIAYQQTLYPQIVDILTELGRYKEAFHYLEKWENISENSDEKLLIRLKLANLYYYVGGKKNLIEAKSIYEEILKLWFVNDSENYFTALTILPKLAMVLKDLGGEKNLLDAKNLLEGVLKKFNTLFDGRLLKISLTIQYNLAMVLKDLGGEKNLLDAKNYLENALKIDNHFGKNLLNISTIQYNLAMVLYDLGGEKNLLDAKNYLENALKIDTNHFGENSQSISAIQFNLAMVLKDLGGEKNLLDAKKLLIKSFETMFQQQSSYANIVFNYLFNLFLQMSNHSKPQNEKEANKLMPEFEKWYLED
jgi:tetratricopeptide (TPR) repeat protein